MGDAPESDDDGESSEDGNTERDGTTVRRFEPGDREAVLGLYRRSIRDAGTDPDDVPNSDDLLDVESAYLDPGGEFLVAEANGEIVAMGGLTVDDVGEDAEFRDGGNDAARERENDDAGELLRIAVHPDHQRRGYGSAIVDALEEAACERGLDRIVLTTARRQAAATEFYPARGYEEIGRRREGEYRLIRFEKPLDE